MQLQTKIAIVNDRHFKALSRRAGFKQNNLVSRLADTRLMAAAVDFEFPIPACQGDLPILPTMSVEVKF